MLENKVAKLVEGHCAVAISVHLLECSLVLCIALGKPKLLESLQELALLELVTVILVQHVKRSQDLSGKKKDNNMCVCQSMSECVNV